MSADRVRALLDEANAIERMPLHPSPSGDPGAWLRQLDERNRHVHGMRCEAAALAALLLVERLETTA